MGKEFISNLMELFMKGSLQMGSKMELVSLLTRIVNMLEILRAMSLYQESKLVKMGQSMRAILTI